MKERCEHLDSLLEPQSKVGGVADHAEQVRGVLLFVLFGPDTANQLGWPDSSVEKVGFYFRGNVSSQADYLITHTSRL